MNMTESTVIAVLLANKNRALRNLMQINQELRNRLKTGSNQPGLYIHFKHPYAQ